MSNTPQPENENLRLQKLHEYHILDTLPEQAFDDIVSLAAQICGTPIALLTLVDSDREWFKAKKGISAKQTARKGGFGAQTILSRDIMLVSNTDEDPRFSSNALAISEPNIRFYAGAPVRAPTGEALGTICVLDTAPRELSAEQIEALRALARQTVTTLELKRKKMPLADKLADTKPGKQHTASEAAIPGSINVGIISTDKQGVIVSFNSSAQRMLGYSEEEVVGKYTPFLFHDANEITARAVELSSELGRPIAPGFEVFIALTRAKNTTPREWTYIRKDGSRFPVMLSIIAVYGAESNISGFIGIAIDMTSIKGIETHVKDSDQLGRYLLDELPIQYCVLDKDGKILAVSKPQLGIEHNHEDADNQTIEIGQNYLTLLDAGLSKTRGGNEFTKGIRSVMSGAKASFSLQYSYQSPSGYRWYSGKVILFPNQELGRVIVIYENITEHKNLEHRFRQTIELAPYAVVIVDQAGTILLVNSKTESYFGYSRTELLGQAVEILIPERFRRAHVDLLREFVAAPVSRTMGMDRNLVGLRKDGSEFPVEIGLSLIKSFEETIIVSSIVDVSNPKRLEHRFRQAVESAPNAIVMVNEAGKIELVNSQTEAFFGYSRNELIGQSVEMLVSKRFRGEHAGFRKAFYAAPQSRPMGAGRDLYGVRKDGSEFPVEIGLSVVDDEKGVLVLSSIVDITERKSISDNLKNALNEKEILLKEVYHRVKNNLQVVSSLINLQARNVKHEMTADLLRQSADRIKSMALLHEKLYQSKDLARINLNEYIRSLVDHLLFGYGAQASKINVNLKVEDMFLDVDTAIPCGLIINELVSNVLKHAFPNDRRGDIEISFSKEQAEYILVIADDGVGFPADLNFEKSTSLGLQLVDTLTRQLMGQMNLEQTRGSRFTIRFPISLK